MEALAWECISALELLKNIRPIFGQKPDRYVDRMTEAANDASRAVSLLQVPFLSAMMGDMENGVDLRSPVEQGTACNGSNGRTRSTATGRRAAI